MAVLQKTRIEGLLTAEAGITLSGGVLTAPSGTINNLTSNTITVNTSVKVGSNTTLTSDSISTDTAEFNTITADTYGNLPIASETLRGISYLTDNYLAGQTGRAVSAVAVHNFYQNITGQMDELEDRVIGVSSDAFNKNPPTLWSVKNYADQMSITGGDILDDVTDSGDMYVEKPAGRPTLNIHIKKFVTQTEFEVLNDLVEELTGGDTGIITDLGNRVSKLESVLPISSFGSTTVYNYIGNAINTRLGWSDDTTVQSKLNIVEGNAEDLVNNLSNRLSPRIEENSSSISNLQNSLTSISSTATNAINLANDLDTRLSSLLSKLGLGPLKYENHVTSENQGVMEISLSSMGINNIEDAQYLTYIVTLNGFVLKGATTFPASGSTSAVDAEYIFVNGGSASTSYIRTVNSLLANQELRVFAFGIPKSLLDSLYTIVTTAVGSSVNSSKKSSKKILW